MIIHRLWLLVMALALALLIGPPARAQRVESSLGTYPLPDVVGMSGQESDFGIAGGCAHLGCPSVTDPFWVVVTVDHHKTYDINGIQFFELKTATGSVVVSADADTAFAKALTANAGKKVRVTVEPYNVQEIRR